MSFINSRTMHDRRQTPGRSTGAAVELIMEHMTAGQVESSTGGVLLSGSRATGVSGVSIDSRTLRPGDLFFAIRGANTDGHLYVAAALAQGACGAVVDRQYRAPADLPQDAVLLRVEDTHQALKDLAAEVRRQWRGSLVAITGSMGKTTTKEFIAHVLQSEYSVYRSPGNYNNLFGLPLSVFGLRADDHIGVFEMGMSARGEIAEMCRIARPDVGVITAVAAVHLEFFQSVEEIALAKAELAEALGPHGTLVYNADDPLVRKIADRFHGNKISFGLQERADVRAEEIEIVGLSETQFKLTAANRIYKADIPLAGLHYVMNTLPAIAVGLHYRISVDQVIESLAEIRQTPMRGQILRFKGGFALIDDSYNSNPHALMLMTETLSRILPHGRRILVAGEMLELGTESRALHRQCGVWAAHCGIEMVVGVQGSAEELVQGAIEGGIAKGHTHFFANVDLAGEFLLRTIQAGDLVLVKGSRGVHLEKVVQAIRSACEMEEA